MLSVLLPIERTALLCLAGLYGPSGKPWPNSVTPGNAQEVSEALERALDDWPDPWEAEGLPIFPWCEFAAAGKQRLREIISACERASFVLGHSRD